MGFSRGYLTVCAVLAIALALPAGGFAAVTKGKLKLSCEEGRLLSLEARAALAHHPKQMPGAFLSLHVVKMLRQVGSGYSG